MAAIVIAGAGAALGAGAASALGFSALTGAGIGWSLGSMLAPKAKTKIAQAATPLADLRITGTEYGQPIPWIRASMVIAGQMWWNTDKRPHSSSTTTTTGGKGGGGGGVETTTTTITYDMDVLYGLTCHQIAGIGRIWEEGKLIWINTSEAPATSILASEASGRWTRLTVYTGDEDQLPDPTYEAAVGTDNAPAYRDRGTIFIEGLQLGQSGQMPNLTFEVLMVAERDELSQAESFTTFSVALDGNIDTQAHSVGGVFWDARLTTARAYSVATGEVLAQFTLASNALKGVASPAGDYYLVLANGALVCLTAGGQQFDFTTNLSATLGTINLPNMHDFVFKDNVIYYGYGTGGGGQLGKIAIDFGALTGTDAGALSSNLTENVAYNGAGISGRLYAASSSNTQTVRWGYYNTVSGGFTTLKTFVQTGFLQMMIGTDGSIYYGDLDGRRNYFVKYDQDGNFVAEVALPGIAATGVSSAPQRFIEDRNGYIWIETDVDPSGGTAGVYFKIDPADMSIMESKAVANANYFPMFGPADYDAGSVITQRSTTALDLLGPGSVLVPGTEDVEDTQAAVFLRAGLTAAQFDVSALSTITKPMRSLAWSQISPARQPTEWLMSAFLYEIVLSGNKLVCRPRGGASAVTIPFDDLGASEGDDMPEPLPLRQSNELELPARVSITYPNVSNDYQTDTQYSDRLISAVDDTVEEIVFAGVGMTPSEAKALADTMLLDRAASVLSTNVSVLGDYCRLEPTDVVILTGRDSSLYRFRIVKVKDSYPVLGYEAVLDDVSVLTSQGITDTDYESSTIVLGNVRTLMRLLDIPILQDADNDAGLYVAAKGDGSPWPGAAIFDSPDNITYSREVDVNESAVFGYCTTPLGDYVGARMFDELSSVTVDVGDGTLESSTRAAILGSLSVNAMLIGSELIQFRTATLSAPGVYVLTGLLRGGRGTEWAMVDHEPNERCVLIRQEGLRRVTLQNNELGALRYYKGVTLGSSASSANAQSFTNTGVGLKPFSPFHLRVSRDASNNATLSWERRSRLTVRTTGPLGISIPLGEEVEAYEVDIYSSGTYATVVDTLTASTTSVEFTAAEQTAAGLTPGNTIYFDVRQMSQVVGRGYETREAA